MINLSKRSKKLKKWAIFTIIAMVLQCIPLTAYAIWCPHCAPGNFKITSVVNGLITFSWGPADYDARLPQFQLWSSNNSNPVKSLKTFNNNHKNPQTCSYQIPSSTLNGTKLCFVLVTYRDGERKGKSAEVCLIYNNKISDKTAPTPPRYLKSANITSSSCTLSWTKSTDNIAVKEYRIYDSAGKLYAKTSSTSSPVTGLSPNKTYSFCVRAYDAANNVSPASNTVKITTLASDKKSDKTAPTAPKNLKSANITLTSCTLSWTKSTDNIAVKEYRIYDSTGKLYAKTSSTSTPVPGLSPNKTYSFYVKAYDAANNASSASNTVKITTLAASTSKKK